MLHRTGRRSRGSGVETPCTTIRQLAADAELGCVVFLGLGEFFFP